MTPQTTTKAVLTEEALAEVSHLKISTHTTPLVQPLDLVIGRGERVGLIGESGSGKSLTALALIGLVPEELYAQGEVALHGICADMLHSPDQQLRRIRGRRVSIVFQEPMTALNPLMKVGKQIAEVIRRHRSAASRKEVMERVYRLIDDVGLPEPERIIRSYPHQLSGGQRQRIMLAIAFANDPDLIICDEPTTALDVTVQRQVLDLLNDVVRERGTSLLFVSHDLAVVAETCDRVLVMENGHVVESGDVRQVLTQPQHDYTKKLVAASLLEPATSSAAEAEEAETDSGHQALVRVTGLEKTYTSGRRRVQVLKDIHLTVQRGQRLGIVGESGSGKTTLLKILAGLERPSAGDTQVCGVDLRRSRRSALRPLREQLQIVFQDPMGSLDPRMTVCQIVEEPLLGMAHPPAAAQRHDLVASTLESVGLSAEMATRYPHQFSGGQRQRISIARALITDPDVLVADEPVSALDVSVQAQVLQLLQRLVEERDLTLIMVSHDLEVIRYLCEDIVVMRSGEIVEAGAAEKIYNDPADDYTRQLLAAKPSLERILAEECP